MKKTMSPSFAVTFCGWKTLVPFVADYGAVSLKLRVGGKLNQTYSVVGDLDVDVLRADSARSSKELVNTLAREFRARSNRNKTIRTAAATDLSMMNDEYRTEVWRMYSEGPWWWLKKGVQRRQGKLLTPRPNLKLWTLLHTRTVRG